MPRASRRWSRRASSRFAGHVPPATSRARGNSTLVEFSLAAEGERTRLRVVESGFPSLDGEDAEKAKYAEENTEGWQAELEDLRRYVAELASVREVRYTVRPERLEEARRRMADIAAEWEDRLAAIKHIAEADTPTR